MHFLLYFAFLLAFHYAHSTLPDLITCTEQNEGTIVVHEEGSWRVCKNKKLIQEACIIGGETSNEKEHRCVKQDTVLNTLGGYMNVEMTAIIAGAYYTDNTRTLVDCVKLTRTKDGDKWAQMFRITPTNNYRCSDGLKKKHWPGAHELCKVDRTVYFMEKDRFFECSSDKGHFVLTKCVIRKADKYMCLSAEQVDNAVRNNGFWKEMEQRIKDPYKFCDNLSLVIDKLYPHYQNDWRPCNEPSKLAEQRRFSVRTVPINSDENEASETETPVEITEAPVEITEAPQVEITEAPVNPTEAPVKPTIEVVKPPRPIFPPVGPAAQLDTNAFRTEFLPNYIDCKNSNNKNALIVDRDSYFRECSSDGTLNPTYCVFPKNDMPSLFMCETHEKIVTKLREYTQIALMVPIMRIYFLDDALSLADCYNMHLNVSQALFYMDKFRTKIDCLTYKGERDDYAKDRWCKMKNGRDVYILHDNAGWYKCKDGAYDLKKCLVKHGSQYKCISKAKIEAYLADKQEALQNLKSGNFCQNFFDTADDLYPSYANDLEPCEDVAAQPNVSPVVSTPAPAPEPAEVLPVESTDTGEQEATNTEDEAVDLSGYQQFTGGWRMKPILRKCREDPVLADGFVSKCNIPTMCVAESEKEGGENSCISFLNVEYMFNNFHRARGYGEHGAWDQEIFEENADWFEENDSDNADLYRSIEDQKIRGGPNLFKTLAEIADDGNDDKLVTISLGKVDVDVSPENVCYILMQLAPFNRDYINLRLRSCPS